MKKALFIFLLFAINSAFAQTDIAAKYNQAESLVQKNNYADAYKILKELEAKWDKKDTLYTYILWYYTGTATQIEKSFREKEKFDSSLAYGLEALQLIQKGKPYFDEKFAAAELYFIDERYPLALPLYLELLISEPTNANINYKIGVCYLKSSSEKNKAIVLTFHLQRIYSLK